MTAIRNVLSSMRVRVFISLAIVSVGMAAYSLAADKRSVSDRATAWAANHTASLPSTLEELAAYPEAYRLQIFKALPAAEKSRLWRVQMQRFVADRPNLTAEQRAFVQYASDLASPASFEPGANPPELCERVAELFPNVEDRRAFTKLGSVAAPAFAWRPAAVSLGETVRSRFTTNAQRDNCNCRGQGWCECSALDFCVNGDCNQVEECGCIFLGMCNRVCEFVISGLRAAPPAKKK